MHDELGVEALRVVLQALLLADHFLDECLVCFRIGHLPLLATLNKGKIGEMAKSLEPASPAIHAAAKDKDQYKDNYEERRIVHDAFLSGWQVHSNSGGP